MQIIKYTAWIAFGACLALSGSACENQSSNPTIPTTTPGESLVRSGADLEGVAGTPGVEFFPLTVGNRWHYQSSFRLYFLEEDGTPAGGGLLIRATIERELIGTEERSGREYVIERQTILEDSRTEPVVWWIRSRQDRTGLYEADVSIGDPPLSTGAPTRFQSAEPERMRAWIEGGFQSFSSTFEDAGQQAALEQAWQRHTEKMELVRRALSPLSRSEFRNLGPPGGVLPDELIRLRYPMRPGSEWMIRPDEDLDFRWRVEAREVLDLPAGRMPAWRIRGISEIFGPEDTVNLWFGPCGFLKLFARLRSEARGPDGEPLGFFVTEQEEILDDIHLIETGRCNVNTN